ncbi:MAG: PAS domain-containing protein [Ktedonobacteraceae bacterium]|nr:PAS domain-containing protein [Ktedonobacteraceae bacterium]
MTQKRPAPHPPGKRETAQATKRRLAEEEIEDLRRQISALLESMTDAAFSLDKTWHITAANVQTEILWAKKREEFLGRNLWDVFPEAIGSGFYQQYHKAMAEGIVTEIEEFYPPHDRWYEVHVLPSNAGLTVYFKDINERKKAQEALAQSEENLRLMANAMPQIVWTARPDGEFDYCNQKWFEYVGTTFEQAQGRRWGPAFHPAEVQACRDMWACSVETGDSYEVEFRLKRAADGMYRWHLGRALPLRDAHGTISKWVGTYTDIDDQKRTEEALRISEARLQDQAKELVIRHELELTNTELRLQRDELTGLNLALEEANRIREQFLSTMSHELRTPLASIIGFSQILLGDTAKDTLDQRQRGNLERILKNGQHLLSLINDVLDLTKIEAGRMVVNYSLVDVRDLLTSLVEEMGPMAFGKNVVMRAEIEEGVDFLESNPLKLRQIVLNLLSNALKFTEQGEVTVSATRVRSPDQQEECLAIAVKDSGIGIPLAIQKRIFEAFYQADGSYTRKIGGTGLGLSIVSQLTTLLGGTVTVASIPGQGSTFTVILPLKAAQHYVEQDIPRLHEETVVTAPSSSEDLPAMLQDVYTISAPQKAPDEHNHLILVVDDNPDAIVLVKEALRDTPYTVVGVQDSLQVMELAQELHPCAITLDVMMPDVNGWQLLHQLKTNLATASIPVVMLTVLSESTIGYVLGADAYLIKPFKTDVMLTTLQRLTIVQEASSRDSGYEMQTV